MHASSRFKLSVGSTNLEPIEITDSTVRRSGRLPKELAILLSGSDLDGRQFSERTKTLVLSKHGASILSRYKLVPEQEIFLRSVANNREIEVRVCGEIGERDDGHIYGVAFVDTNVDFWGIEFPPSQKLPISLAKVLLECTGCKERTTVQFDAMEMDVYTVNDGVLRYCKRCLGTTVWKRASAEGAKAEAAKVEAAKVEAAKVEAAGADAGRVDSAKSGSGTAEFSAPLAAEAEPSFETRTPTAVPPPPKAVPNRRRDRRTKVKCKACIRASGSSEEVVSCEDMSRGGFSFSSSREYSVEAMIEAAVPYSPGGSSIFVPAQIANIRELQKGKLFRYGAAYMVGGKK